MKWPRGTCSICGISYPFFSISWFDMSLNPTINGILYHGWICKSCREYIRSQNLEDVEGDSVEDIDIQDVPVIGTDNGVASYSQITWQDVMDKLNIPREWQFILKLILVLSIIVFLINLTNLGRR